MKIARYNFQLTFIRPVFSVYFVKIVIYKYFFWWCFQTPVFIQDHLTLLKLSPNVMSNLIAMYTQKISPSPEPVRNIFNLLELVTNCVP